MAGEIAGVTSPAVLLDLVHDIVKISGGFSDAFKKDCTDLVRRISLLTHLFEEIKRGCSGSGYAACDDDDDESSSVSSSSSRLNKKNWLIELVTALSDAKRLLVVAGGFDSTSLSDGASKKVAFQFQCVTCKLKKALGNLPYDHFDISEEVREQVELLRTQLRRATERHRPFNLKLLYHKEIDSDLLLVPKGNHMAGTRTHQVSDLEASCNSSISSGDDQSGSTVDDKGDLNNEIVEDIKKPESVVIPDDYLCPISLELMRDPVIVATGQTYERVYIQRWIEGGNVTCPKTQQQLQNLTLTPNYVLRSLISHWCTNNNIEQPTVANGKLKKSDGSLRDVSDDIATIEALVRKLSSRSVEERRTAATEIRSLSKRSTDNRILIAEAGAIPILVKLLTTEDIVTQENAVTSILNLSIYENNKALVMLAGAIPSIVQVLRTGSMEARENAAATLFSLSVADENKIIIGTSGALPALVDLLENGSARGKKDAAAALYNLCMYQGNKGRSVRAGIITALLNMLTDSTSNMVDEALAILSVLASHQEAKAAIVKATTFPVLISLMRTGLPRSKENATAILLSLCKRDNESLARIRRLGALVPLSELAESGSERAKRKASSLLKLLQKLQQP